MFIETAIRMFNLGMAPTPVAAADALLTNYRPSQIAEFLERYWNQGAGAPLLNLDVPAGQIAAHQNQARLGFIDGPVGGLPPIPPVALQSGWHHLVYAFMLEQTRIYDIFRRLIYEYVNGERLPHATHQTLLWLRTTEELFFSSPQLLTVRGVTSGLRPDDASIRRNMYYRMLGMDLNHGTDDGRAYPYEKASTANRDFVILFETLLSEVWKGYTNRNPGLATTDTTDDNAIATLVNRLQQMLVARRLLGNLSREEFLAVACLSWMRLVVSVDTQVVTNLSAQAIAEADRLKQIANMVGMSAHTRADAYFRLAQPMSVILREIENGAIGAVALLGGLYLNGSPYQAPMLQIITNWSIATGRDLKDPSRRQATLPVLTEAARVQPVNGNGTYPASRIPAGLLR